MVVKAIISIQIHAFLVHKGSFYQQGLSCIPPRISTYIHYKVCDKLHIQSQIHWCDHWSLEMDMQFHTTLYWTCDYASMLGLKSAHISKRGPRCVAWCWLDVAFISVPLWWFLPNLNGAKWIIIHICITQTWLADFSRMVAQVPASDEQTFYEWIVIFDAQLFKRAHCI